jgi:flagellar M-ring protein FliF
MWRRLDRGAKVALIGGAAVILVGTAWMLYLALKQDYGVLFSDLTQSDAAAIVERLRESKTKYKLSENGTTVSVAAEQVHDVRLALMSSDLPLSGGVGFEIFDRQGLGATEHSQRVSYQRALQGELSRTIGTLEGVKQARVHLVLPESSLFRKDQQQATAAVTLAMKPGASVDRPRFRSGSHVGPRDRDRSPRHHSFERRRSCDGNGRRGGAAASQA